VAIVLAITGLVLVAFAPVWRFVIGPSFIKLPADLTVHSSFTGTLQVFADRATTRFYPNGKSVDTALAIDARDSSVPSRGNGSVLVLDEHVQVKDAGTSLALEGVRPDTTYVLDRSTCQNVPGYIEGIERTGYTVKYPMLAQKKSYPMWDDELGRTILSKFKGTTTVDGDKYKGISAYIYETEGEMEKMVKPPPGLPRTISGKQVREMSGMIMPDNAEFTLEYYKKTVSKDHVEPKTGTVVATPEHHYEYYVKNGPGMSPTYLKLARVEYKSTAARSRKDVDGTVKYIRLINADLQGAPAMFLVLGVVFIVVAVVVDMRSSKKRRAGDDDRVEP
jgi:hypothetical protein